jgi:hypothetical protein
VQWEIKKKDPDKTAASLAFFRLSCDTECLGPNGERTRSCLRRHGDKWPMMASSRQHSVTTTTWAILFLAGFLHRTLLPLKGHRYTVQLVLEPSRRPGSASKKLLSRLQKGPGEERVSIQPDSILWQLINNHVERLATETEDDKFLIRRSRGAADDGEKYGLYLDFEEAELAELKEAIEKDKRSYRLRRFLKKYDLTLIYARCLLVDSSVSAFKWHRDNSHNKIAANTVICHFNWMLSEDYVAGSLADATSTGDAVPTYARALFILGVRFQFGRHPYSKYPDHFYFVILRYVVSSTGS